MNNTLRKIIIISTFFFAFTINAQINPGDEDPDQEEEIPIDGGLGIAFITGSVYFFIRLRKVS